MDGDVPVIEREFVLRADFDLLDDQGCSWISSRFLHGPRRPVEGDAVYLIDGRRRGCVGTVECIVGCYVCVKPDWATWVGDELPRGARPRPPARRFDRASTAPARLTSGGRGSQLAANR